MAISALLIARQVADARANGINIVTVAICIIAGPKSGRVDRAAKIIVSSPTPAASYTAGNLRGARGVDLLRVHDLSGIPLELLLGADGQPTGAGRTVRRNRTRIS